MTEKLIQELKSICALQCADGNWNFDHYMHGMANGLIFAVSIMEGKETKYLDAPDKWLDEKADMHTELVEALKGLSDMYGAAFDMVGGDLIMTGSHVDLFEERHAKAQEVLNKATKEG